MCENPPKCSANHLLNLIYSLTLHRICGKQFYTLFLYRRWAPGYEVQPPGSYNSFSENSSSASKKRASKPHLARAHTFFHRNSGFKKLGFQVQSSICLPWTCAGSCSLLPSSGSDSRNCISRDPVGQDGTKRDRFSTPAIPIRNNIRASNGSFDPDTNICWQCNWDPETNMQAGNGVHCRGKRGLGWRDFVRRSSALDPPLLNIPNEARARALSLSLSLSLSLAQYKCQCKGARRDICVSRTSWHKEIVLRRNSILRVYLGCSRDNSAFDPCCNV